MAAGSHFTALANVNAAVVLGGNGGATLAAGNGSAAGGVASCRVSFAANIGCAALWDFYLALGSNRAALVTDCDIRLASTRTGAVAIFNRTAAGNSYLAGSLIHRNFAVFVILRQCNGGICAAVFIFIYANIAVLITFNLGFAVISCNAAAWLQCFAFFLRNYNLNRIGFGCAVIVGNFTIEIVGSRLQIRYLADCRFAAVSVRHILAALGAVSCVIFPLITQLTAAAGLNRQILAHRAFALRQTGSARLGVNSRIIAARRFLPRANHQLQFTTFITFHMIFFIVTNNIFAVIFINWTGENYRFAVLRFFESGYTKFTPTGLKICINSNFVIG